MDAEREALRVRVAWLADQAAGRASAGDVRRSRRRLSAAAVDRRRRRLVAVDTKERIEPKE